LVHTLDVFLRCGGNRVRAAEDLFVHHNTLRYRLSQIDRLVVGLSGDATTWLNLQLALAAHRLLKAVTRSERASRTEDRRWKDMLVGSQIFRRLEPMTR
jgi:hypothetical protein